VREDWTTWCQVTRDAVAEPTGIEADVLVLGNGELAFGALDVIAVEPVIDAHLQRRSQAPTVLLKFSARFCIVDVGCHLECFAGFFWRGDEPEKFAGLTPEIFFSAPGDVFQAARGPVCDRS